MIARREAENITLRSFRGADVEIVKVVTLFNYIRSTSSSIDLRTNQDDMECVQVDFYEQMQV